MTTIELEIEVDEPYELIYDELTEQTETPIEEILEANLQGTTEDLLHRIRQEARQGGQ